MVNQFQKDTLDTLGILYKNYLLQKKQKIEVFFGDFKSSGMDPETFLDTVHTLKQHGFSIDEYDHDWTLTKGQEVGARNTPCCEVTLPDNFEKLYQKLQHETTSQSENAVPDEIKQKVRFDALNARVVYGDTYHKFQRGSRDEKTRYKLFKELWSRRCYIKNGKEKIKGEMMQAGHLAAMLGISSDASTFNRNKNLQEKLFGMTKNITRVFRDKKMPIKIKRQNGIQLEVKE